MDAKKQWTGWTLNALVSQAHIITGVAGHRAFVIGIVDLFSRKVMAYNVVNTMDAFHCVETLQMAVSAFGRPEIFNSDQGSQFTSTEFIHELRGRDIQISMDGRAL